MANAVINQAGSDYQVTGSTRVHGYLALDLSAGDVPGGAGAFTVIFPFTGVATPGVVLQHGSATVPLTLPAPTTQSSTAVLNYRVEWSSTDAGGLRTVLISIFDTSGTGSSADNWTVKIAPIPSGPATTTVTENDHVISSMTVVEADPFMGVTTVVPSPAFSGQTITLSGTARRNTLPLPAAAGPTPLMTWSQLSGPSAPVPPGSTVIAPAMFSSPAAPGFSAVASFALPAFAASATLDYGLTASFGDFTATSSVTLQVSALADYWMLVVDRSGTMGQGTPLKRTNATVTARIWADVISAFRYSTTTPDRIGLIDFSDSSAGGFRASPPAGVNVAWPAASAMGPLKAITDPNQDQFKVGGTSVLGAPADQTPLGDALIKALDVMAGTSSSNPNFRYHVLVVSDGIENTGTIKVDAASLIGNAALAQTFDAIKSSGPRSIFNYTSTGNVRVYPVGTGLSTVTNTTVLNSLGSYGLGPYSVTTTVDQLFPNAFGTALFSALGASQQNVFAAPPVNTDPSPLGTDKQAYFVVPNDESKLVVVVLWNNPMPPNANTLDLSWRTQLQPSPPNPFTSLPSTSPALTVANRDTHSVAVVDLAQLTSAATEWRVSYKTGTTVQTILPAHVLTGRDLRVRTAITFDRTVYYNDEPIVLTASAHAGPDPITGAKVVVEVEGPAVSEGELLVTNSRLAAPAKTQKLPTDGPHPASRDAFLARILAEKNMAAFPTVKYSSVFADGTNELHPDRNAGDGYYSNAFMKNWREGTYNFKVTISGKTAEGGSFSDVHAESRLVKLRPEDAFSTITVGKGLDGLTSGLRSARIRVTPKDALGQHLGPFHASDVQFQTTRGGFIDEVETELDGSYSQILVYPARQVPVVTAQIQGRSFTPVVLSQGLSGAITAIVRRIQGWLVRSARHR